MWPFLCCAVLGIVSCFTIILLGKRELYFYCLLMSVAFSILCLFLKVPWFDLEFAIVALSGHFHLLFHDSTMITKIHKMINIQYV